MTLTLDQIIELFEHPANKENIELSRKKHREYNMHFNGIGLDKFLEYIEGYENQQQKKLRDKLARSNRALYGRLTHPVNKIFSAKNKGGTDEINLSANLLKDFKSQKYNGYDMTRWIKYRMNKLFTDPNGLFFVEWKEELGKTKAYPTYKSIETIRDYIFEGLQPEYVIFEPYKKEKIVDGKKVKSDEDYFRVVDDEFDYLIEKSGTTYSIVEDETYPNPYGKVPAIPCGDQWSDVFLIFESPIDISVETASEYLQNNSTRSIYKYKHLFPIFWRYLSDCPNCKGSGQLDGEDCSYCQGTSVKLSKDVSDVLGLQIPQEGEQKITPDVAGYVQPELETLRETRTELKELVSEMEYSLWGSHSKEDSSNETATAMFLNVQPVDEKLNYYSDWGQWVQSSLTDIICSIQYGEAYDGNVIIWGRKYLLEPSETQFDSYVKAKDAGSPDGLLNYKIDQYFQTEFYTDPVLLEKQQKLLGTEPFPHLTIEQVQKAEVEPLDYYKKVYHSDWLKTLKEEDILKKPLDQLDQMLTKYTQDKLNETQINQN